MGADAPHNALVLRFLRTAAQRSIRAHARTIAVPKLAADRSQLAVGARHYAEMCAECHLAPDTSDSELRRGLYPEPPNLMTAPQMSPAEAFWVIKHGVKLTSMPAWGTTHDDAIIWDLVAFVRRLPTLREEDYRALLARAAEDEDADHESGSEHADSAHVNDTAAHGVVGEHHHATGHHHD